jgi:hypothetical protein
MVTKEEEARLTQDSRHAERWRALHHRDGSYYLTAGE